MDSALNFVEPSEKRPAAEGLEGAPPKKSRGLAGDVKEVAEMVLVLAAMGKMRGGKGPTDVEKELMFEARNRLTKVCEGFAPKDVFPRDAFGGVIEDLGLNKLKEQRLGFRTPKMSIAEKLLISKRKMEKAEVFSLPSTPQSSRLHPSSGAAVESRNALHSVRTSQPDKSSNMPITSGSFQSASPLSHSTAVNSTSLPYQLPISEIRPIVSNTVSSSHLSSAASPRVEWHHLRSDGRPNGSSHPSQVHANYSANSTARTPTWSVQSQPALISKTGSDNKVAMNMSVKVDRAAGVNSSVAPHTSRTVVSQTIGGPPSQGANHVQPLGNAHAEISKTVQKLLRPRVSERPTWTSPSRDYMNKALTCHICMLMVMEIDSILICDACEKGYHLKCLQTTNQKGVPRGEWHCGKCLSFTNGKPLPPKYGRVMRNINTPKTPSNLAASPSASSKTTIGALDEKAAQSKAVANGITVVENSPSVAVGNNYSQQTSVPERKVSTVMQENNSALSSNKMNDKVSSGTETSSSPAEKTGVNKVAELKPNSSTEPLMVLSSSDKLPGAVNAVEANASKQPLENHSVVRDSKETCSDECSNISNQLKEQEIVRDNDSVVAASAGTINQGRSSSDGLHAVNWVGGPVQTLDGKVYYASCCINGHLYKATDHVLVRFDNGKLIPSKLLAMWEDTSTTMKWVMANQCYFPGDLPEAVGRPCGLESSEVYESNCGRAMMAGLIESPCEVLPPWRFAEETDKRIHSGNQSSDNLPPLYLCRWIYDEAKGLFRDISC